MPSLSIARMSDLGDDRREDVARVFVDGYLDILKSVSKDRDRWAGALASAFVPEVFFVALDGDEVLGIAACSSRATRAMYLQLDDFREHLGFVRGTLAHRVMRPNFEAVLDYPASTGYVECVATSEKARGRGVATRLMEHIHTLPYDDFVLEVTDTNTGARRLYEKLGYQESSRKRSRFPWLTGHEYALYLHKTKPALG